MEAARETRHRHSPTDYRIAVEHCAFGCCGAELRGANLHLPAADNQAIRRNRYPNADE
jgi:hypothetical protein